MGSHALGRWHSHFSRDVKAIFYVVFAKWMNKYFGGNHSLLNDLALSPYTNFYVRLRCISGSILCAGTLHLRVYRISESHIDFISILTSEAVSDEIDGQLLALCCASTAVNLRKERLCTTYHDRHTMVLSLLNLAESKNAVLKNLKKVTSECLHEKTARRRISDTSGSIQRFGVQES